MDHDSDSELFGADSFVPGAKRVPKWIESSDQGTLFLEEVGELSPKQQVKLLGFLQDRENDRVAGSWSKKLNIRLIASSTTPLLGLVKEKRFRQDLYYRLNVAYIALPPLRERPEEILPLVEVYLQNFCREYNLKKRFKNETLEILKHYSFPGNILELRNLVEILCITSNWECILPTDLPDHIRPEPVTLGTLEAQVGKFESRLIRQALEREDSIRKAAARLGVSHATLLRKMQKWGIQL